MNINTCNKLPPDIQEIMTRTAIADNRYWADSTVGQTAAIVATGKRPGYEIVTLPPDEMAK